jgi:hypothetical protein
MLRALAHLDQGEEDVRSGMPAEAKKRLGGVGLLRQRQTKQSAIDGRQEASLLEKGGDSPLAEGSRRRMEMNGESGAFASAGKSKAKRRRGGGVCRRGPRRYGLECRSCSSSIFGGTGTVQCAAQLHDGLPKAQQQQQQNRQTGRPAHSIAWSLALGRPRAK